MAPSCNEIRNKGVVFALIVLDLEVWMETNRLKIAASHTLQSTFQCFNLHTQIYSYITFEKAAIRVKVRLPALFIFRC